MNLPRCGRRQGCVGESPPLPPTPCLKAPSHRPFLLFKATARLPVRLSGTLPGQGRGSVDAGVWWGPRAGGRRHPLRGPSPFQGVGRTASRQRDPACQGPEPAPPSRAPRDSSASLSRPPASINEGNAGCPGSWQPSEIMLFTCLARVRCCGQNYVPC